MRVTAMPRKTRPELYFLLPLLLLPCLAYGYVLVNDSVNFPVIDDYYAILGFLNNYAGAGSGQARWDLLFSQNNEHIITTTYLAELLILKLTGEFNFQYLLLLAALLLPATLVLLYALMGLKHIPGWYFFVPASYLLLHLQYSEMAFWPMAAFSHIACSFFAFCFLYALNRRTRAGTVLAALFLALACFSNGNGVFLFPFGLLLLLLQKRYKELAGLALFSAYLLWTYFSRYHGNNDRGYGIGLHNAGQVLWFYLTLTGNYTDLFAKELAPFTGLAALGVFAYLTLVKKLYRVNAALFALILFFFETLAIITISRFRDGAEMAHRPLYSFYANLLLILLFAGMLVVHDRKPPSLVLKGALIAWSAFAIAFCAVSYRKYYPVVLYLKHGIISDAVDWKNRASSLYLAADQSFSFPRLDYQYELSKAALYGNYSADISRYVSRPVNDQFPAACRYEESPTLASQFIVFQVDGYLNASSPYIKVKAETTVATGELFFLLQSKKGCYFYSAYRSVPAGLRSLTPNPWLLGVIPKATLPPGAYRLGFAHREAGQLKVCFSQQYINTGLTPGPPVANALPVRVDESVESAVDLQQTTVLSCEFVNNRLHVFVKSPVPADTVAAAPGRDVLLALKTADSVSYFTGQSIAADSILTSAGPTTLYHASIPLQLLDHPHPNRSVNSQVGVGYPQGNGLKVNYAPPLVTVPLQVIPSVRVAFPPLSGLLARHATQDITLSIDQVIKQADQLIVEGWAGAPTPAIGFDKVYFAALSPLDTVVFQAARIDRPDVTAHLRGSNPEATSSGFFLNLPTRLLSPGQPYDLYLVAEKADGARVIQKVDQLAGDVLGGCNRPVAVRLPGRESNVRVTVDETQTQAATGCLTVSGWCRVNGMNYAHQQVTVVVDNGRQRDAYPATSISRPDVQDFFRNQGQPLELRDAGYSTSLPLHALKQCRRVGFLITVGGKSYLKWMAPEDVLEP